MFLLKRIAACGAVVLVSGAVLFAQPVQRQRPAPRPAELITYLGLNDTQVSCLKTNRQSFRVAVAPLQKQLMDLQAQFRQARRDGTDTAALRPQVESVLASIQSTRDQHVASAQLCVAGNANLANLIAAETLMREVQEAIGLLLVKPTDGGPGGMGMGLGPGMGRPMGRGPRGGPPLQ